jgi:hypothetical protein
VKNVCKRGHDLTKRSNIYIKPGTTVVQCKECRNGYSDKSKGKKVDKLRENYLKKKQHTRMHTVVTTMFSKDKQGRELWVKERGTDTYCPLEIDDVGNITNIVTGMNYIGLDTSRKDVRVVGEFWYDNANEIKLDIYP